MSGIIGVFGDNLERIEKTQLISTIDLLSLCDKKVFNTEFGFLSNATKKNFKKK